MDEKNQTTEVSETSKIETVDDLEASYPQLVSEIRDCVVREIESWPAKKLRKEFPDLCRRIGAEIGRHQGPNMKVKGFFLDEFKLGERGRTDKNVGDPFSVGTLRFYAKLKKIGDLQLPYILPFDCPFTRPTIEHYILVSEGGGDYERAGVAREALKKCK